MCFSVTQKNQNIDFKFQKTTLQNKVLLVSCVVVVVVSAVITALLVAGLFNCGPISQSIAQQIINTAAAPIMIILIFAISIIKIGFIIKKIILDKKSKSEDSYKDLKWILSQLKTDVSIAKNVSKRAYKPNFAFPGFSNTSESQLLTDCLYVLPQMHSALMNLISTLGNKHPASIDLYKECLELSSMIRNLVLLTILDIENDKLLINKLDSLLNPINNPLAALVLYPTALSYIFEREIAPLYLDTVIKYTHNFQQLKILNILSESCNNVLTNTSSDLSEKEDHLDRLKSILQKIDDSSKTSLKLKANWLLDLAEGKINEKIKLSLNAVLTSLLYHNVYIQTNNKQSPSLYYFV